MQPLSYTAKDNLKTKKKKRNQQTLECYIIIPNNEVNAGQFLYYRTEENFDMKHKQNRILSENETGETFNIPKK